MANTYQGKILNVETNARSVNVKCQLGKKKLIGYLHEHNATVSLDSDVLKKDKFLKNNLKSGGKIRVVFG